MSQVNGVHLAPTPTPTHLPPRSQEAERAVLGSCLRSGAVVPDVLKVIQAESFYEDAHQKVFQALVSLYDQNKPIDLVTVAEKLLEDKQLDDVGGAPYLYKLFEGTPTAANAEYYAGIVRDRFTERSLIHAASEILRDTYDRCDAPADLLASAEQKIAQIAETHAPPSSIVFMPDAMQRAKARYDARAANGGHDLTGLPFGFLDLDALTLGMQESQFIVVGGRPSSGKTLFSLQAAVHVARTTGERVLFISKEQPEDRLSDRMWCGQAKVNYKKFQKGQLNAEEIGKLQQAADWLSDIPLAVADLPSWDALQLKAAVRQHRKKHGCRVVVIDYFELIRAPKGKDTREQELSEISSELVRLTKELRLTTILLAQLNRESENNKRKPRLSDLRYTGKLEQDADLVILLHRADNEAFVVTAIVAKGRDSGIGEVSLVARFDEMRFENMAQGPNPFA